MGSHTLCLTIVPWPQRCPTWPAEWEVRRCVLLLYLGHMGNLPEWLSNMMLGTTNVKFF